MTDVSVGASLIGLVVYILGWGVLFSTAAVATVRKAGPRWVWIGWAIVTCALTVLGTVAFHRSIPAADRVLGTIYMLSVLVGVPTAAVALAAARISRRNTMPGWARHTSLTLLAYFGALPIALLLGLLPDIARLF